MIIKNFKDFIFENYNDEIHNSLGEYIEDLAKDDEYIQMIVGQMTDDINPSIRLSNAINLLDELTKVELLKRVENYLNGEEGETKVTTTINAKSVEPNEQIQESYGKSVLNTFFKCLTALGFKDNTQQTKEIPSEFLIFFKFNDVESSKIASVFNRFKSLKSIEIDYTYPNIGLYFGIKCDGLFEYGYYYDELIPIGQFKLNKSTFNKLKLSDLKSTSGLRKTIVDLNFEDIKLLCKIKNEVEKFNPGYFEQKAAPIINGRVITFAYYGTGKWDNGKLDAGEFENIKNNFKSYLIKYMWSDKIMMNISANNFWVYIQIKLK
jgi:hypothetical protein